MARRHSRVQLMHNLFIYLPMETHLLTGTSKINMSTPAQSGDLYWLAKNSTIYFYLFLSGRHELVFPFDFAGKATDTMVKKAGEAGG